MGRDDAPHRQVADLLASAPGAQVCEVGCGPGQLLVVLARPDRGTGRGARVLGAGGSLLIAWHSAGSPNPIQRRLALPDMWWEQTLGTMRRLFVDVARHDLTRVTAAVGVKPAAH
jgi:hypothetical protein